MKVCEKHLIWLNNNLFPVFQLKEKVLIVIMGRHLFSVMFVNTEMSRLQNIIAIVATFQVQVRTFIILFTEDLQIQMSTLIKRSFIILTLRTICKAGAALQVLLKIKRLKEKTLLKTYSKAEKHQ